MPGFFGGVGHVRDEVERLRSDFAAIWGSVEFIAADGAALGGHAFVDTPVARLESGAIVARDGEAGFMRTTIGDARPGLHGVGVMAEASQGTIEVTTDPTAVFPLFYAELPAGVLVSTLLRPLARVLGAAPDPVAIAEYLRFANTFDHRSLFAGIRRLGPGQRLTWSPERGVKISEHSRLWASRLDEIESPEEAAEALQPMLKTALALGLPEHGEHVLMMSAGWDSRSLLAGLAEWFPTADVATFSHGDLRSRELALARKLSEIAGVSWRGRTVGPDVWDPDHLSRSFARTETLVFPHWSWAGVENQEAATVSSGILGEVLGGHYGTTHVARGGAKVAALLRGLDRGAAAVDDAEPMAAAFASLALGALDRPWYLNPEVEGGRRAELLDEINQDITRDLERLEARGVRAASQMIEAFVTEHRGVRYIAGQARALRVAVDTSLPYGHEPLLTFAAALPQPIKIHNRVNRALGLRLSPQLGRPAMAATLVPGTWPLLAQEASRVVRKAYETLSWGLYRSSRGRTPRAHLGWVDFEFLRDGSEVLRVAEHLRSDLWNRPAFDRLAMEMRTFQHASQLHPVFDQIGKILTVDRMIGG